MLVNTNLGGENTVSSILYKDTVILGSILTVNPRVGFLPISPPPLALPTCVKKGTVKPPSLLFVLFLDLSFIREWQHDPGL